MDNRASSRNSAERIRSSSTGRPASADRTLSARAGIARPTAVDNNPTKQARGVDKSKPSFAQKSLSHPNEQHVHPNSSARTDWSGQSMGVRTSRPSSAYSRNSSFARFDPLQTDHQADQLYNQSLSAELAQIRSAKKSQPIKSYTENSSSPSNEAAMISLEKSKRSTCVTDQDTGPHLSMLPAFRTATSKKQVKSPRESSSRVSGSTAKDQVIAAEVEQSDNWVLHQFDNKSYNKKRNPAKSNEASAVTGLTLSTKQLQVSKMEKTVSEGEQLQFGSHTTKSNHKQNSAVPFDELSYEVRGVDWTIKGEVSTKASGRRFQSDHLPPPYNLLQVPVQPSRRVLRGTAEEMPDSEVEAAADVNSAERSKNHLQLYKALQLAEQQQEQKAENERRKEVADRRWVFGLVQNQSEEIGQTY